uniref:SpaA isopeptide-forming pilin-related protein n=1 Tax=Eubacterium cellulosolvens TaxID=29322 RepID=UPI0004836894|nr:SpaA isopeptide-forming pilin-related protein [[Eubacterium] cellulosolvens]
MARMTGTGREKKKEQRTAGRRSRAGRTHTYKSVSVLLLAFLFLLETVYGSAGVLISSAGTRTVGAEVLSSASGAEPEVEESGGTKLSGESEEEEPENLSEDLSGDSPEDAAPDSPEPGVKEDSEQAGDGNAESVVSGSDREEPEVTQKPSFGSTPVPSGKAEKEEKKKEDTRSDYTYNDGRIRVSAHLQDPKAVPDDAVLRVQPITNRTAGYSYQAYMDALNAEAGTPGRVAYTADNTWLYDVGFFVTPTDEDGNVTGDEYEYEPEAGSVSIHMQIVDADLAKCVEKEETVPTLTHLRLADPVKLGADTTEQVTGASASDVICEEMAGSVSVSGYQAEVAFSLDSFSAIAITIPEGSGNHSAESRVIENNVDAEFYEVKGYSVDHPEKGEDFLTEKKDGLATYSLPSGMSMNELDQVGIGLQLTVVDPENRTLMGGDYFDLKIPEFLIVDEAAVGTQNSPTVVKTDDNRNEILTYYKVPGENTIRIAFTDAVNKSNYLYNITARLSYVFQVNQKLISALENEQLYEIEMANGQKIRILVLPRSKEILGVSKEGKIDKTDQKTVTWTVIAGSDGSSRGVSLAGVTLTDTFNSKEQKIRSVRLGEQEIYTEDGGVSDSALSFDTAESDGMIRMEYVFPENTALTAPATFTVVTEVTEAAVEKANRNANVDTKVSNQARITGDPVDETKEKNSDQAEVTIPVVRLTKSGEQIGGDRIRWTINLNSSQSNVYKCVVKDTMTGGLVLDPDTVRYSSGKIFTGGEAETPVGTSPDANGISFAAGEDAGDGALRAPSDGSVGDTLHISFDQPFSDAYTITFETTIDHERAGGAAGDGSGSVDLANTSQYKNSATVLVYFPDGSGSGPSVEYGVPDIGTEMYTLYLTKQVSARTVPDPKTGLISWELVPGTRLQTGKTAELCDTIPEGHTLMKDSFRIVYRDPDANGAEKELTEGTDYEITGIPDNTDGSVSGIAKSGNDLQVTLKNADAVRDLSHVMFTVVTRDDKYLGGNVRSRSVNRATILLTEDSGKVFTSNEATAENTWGNELLSKKGEVVCSSKNEPLFHYTIGINRKANRLTDVVFEDDFTEGNAQSNLIYYTSGGKKYALDREEYTILGADAAQYKPVIRDSVGRVLSSDKVTVDVQNDAAGKKISAAWKEPLEDACVLEFYVKIHTDSVDFYEKEGFLGTDSSGQEALPVTFGADNTCALRFKPRNKKDAEVTASAGSEAALSASVLGKKGLYNKEGRTNSWTIDINPAGMSLSTGSGNPVLRDTVPASQNLQKKTIVLCRVDQSTSPNGMIQLFDGSKDAFGAENGNRVKVTVKKERSGITNLQIDFPSDAGTSAYRLTYNTVVTKAAAADAVSNTAELTWGSAPHTAFVTATAEALASGSASANQFSMMTMTKVDALSVDGTPIPIPFAEYELYTKDENGAVDEVVDSAWTDANGQITFVCDTGKEYYIKEVAAPEVTDDLGYALDSQEYGPYEPKPGPQDIGPRNAAGSSMKKYFTDERDTSLFKTGSVEVTKIFDKSDPQADYTGVGSSNGYQAGFQLLVYPNGKSGKSRVVDTLLETSAEGVYVYDQKSADSENNAQASLSVVKTGASKANTSGLQEAKLSIRNLPWGQYALQEVDSQQPGYVKNAKLYYFNVSKVTSGDASVVFEDSETGDNRVTIHNVPTKLTVKKLDASGNAIGGGADGALAEAEFLLTAMDKSNFALSTNVQYPLSDDELSFMLRGSEFSDDGTLSLSGILVHGESYTLKEVKPPAGYTTAAAVTGIKGGDAVEAVVKDTKTSFTFKKTDQNGEKVAGATLTLKGRFADTADGSRIPATAASPEVVFSGAGVQQEAVWTTTATKADVTFTGKLIAGETYLLTESMEDQSGQYTEPKAEIRLQVSEDGKKITLTGGDGTALAPTAATADTDAKDASVGIGAYITGVNTVNIRNHRYLASFSFEKVDNTAEKNGISGAVFKLERLKEDPQDPSRKVTDQTMQGIATNADGKFISSGSSLTNIFYGSTVANRKLSKGIPVGTYVLTETKAPDGYYTNPDLTWEFAVTADDDGKNVVRTASAGDPGEGALVNYIRPVTLRITKRDVNDSTKVLKGAEYTLYTDKDCKTKADTMDASFLQEKTDGTAADTYANPQVTDDRGEICFASLPWGTYYLKETKAPKSYRRDANTYRIVVGRDGVSFGNNSEVSDSRLGRLTENLTENEGGRIRVYETELSDSPTQLYVVKTDQFGKNADGVILTIYEADGTTKIDEFEFTGHQDVKDAPKWNLTGKLNAGGTYIIRETYRDEAAEKKYQKPHETGDVTKRIDKYTVHVSENGSAWELDALEDGYVLTGTSADPELKNDVALNIDQGSVLGIVNKRIMGTTAILQKAAVNSNENGTGKKYKYLDGAVFALYQEGAQGSWTKIKEFTTGNGYGFLTTSNFDDYVDENKFTKNGGLVAGNYMLKEVRAPKGYQINPTEYGFSVDSASDGKVIVIDSKTPDQPITDYRLEDMIPKWPDSYPGTPVLDEPIPGQIRVKKTASDGTSPLEGAVFELYEDKACTTPAEYYDTFDRTNGAATGGIATNADGEAVFYGLAWDTVYWVKEIAAPTGYAVNGSVQPVRITAGDYRNTIDLEDAPAGEASGTKISAGVTEATVVDGDQVKVEADVAFSDAMTEITIVKDDQNQQLTYEDGVELSVYAEEQKKEDGSFEGEPVYRWTAGSRPLSGSASQTGSSGNDPADGGQTENPNARVISGILTAGCTYELVEKDNTMFCHEDPVEFRIDAEGKIVLPNGKNRDGRVFTDAEGKVLTLTNRRIFSGAAFVKTDAENSFKKLEKAEYGLYWAGGYLGGYSVDADTLLQVFSTDGNGLVSTVGNMTKDTIAEGAKLNDRQKSLLAGGLLPGHYYFRETDAPFYYAKSDTKYAFTIDESCDGKVVLLGENAGQSGSFVKGTVPLTDGQQKETLEAKLRKAAEDGETYVTDQRLPGVIELDKVRKDHISEHVGGAEYSVFTARACTEKDLAAKEGSAFDLEKNFENRVVTDSDGLAVFANLKWGRYYIKETKAALGYQIDPYVYEVVVGENSYGDSVSLRGLSEQNGHILSTWTGEDAIYTFITVQDYANTLTISKRAQIFANQASKESGTEAQGGALFRIRLLDKDLNPTVSTTQNLSTDRDSGKILWERQQVGLIQGYAYQIEEVEAPEGYMLIAPIRFMIMDDYGTVQLLDGDNRPAREVTVTDAEGEEREGASLVARVEQSVKTENGQQAGSSSGADESEDGQDEKTRLCDFTIVITNPQQDNRILLTKTDRCFGTPVRDAKYQLYESREDLTDEIRAGTVTADDSRLTASLDADGKEIILQTNADGEAVFTHLTPGKYYYVTEKAAPSGYRLDGRLYAAGKFRSGVVDEPTYHGETKELKVSDVPVSSLKFTKVLLGNEDEGNPSYLPLQGVQFAFYTDEEAKTPYRIAQMTGKEDLHEGSDGHGSGTQADPAAASGETEDSEEDCVIPEDLTWTGGLEDNKIGAEAVALTGGDGTVNITGLPHTVLYMKEVRRETGENDRLRENRTIYRVDLTGKAAEITAVTREPGDGKTLRVEENNGKTVTQIVNRYTYGSVSVVKLDREDYLGRSLTADGEEKEPKMTAIAGSAYGLFRRADTILEGPQTLQQVSTGTAADAASEDAGSESGGRTEETAGDVGNTKTTGETGKTEENSGTRNTDDMTDGGIWVQVAQAETNSYGRITFDRLIPGYDYKIQEVAAPAGYRKSRSAFYFSTSLAREETAVQSSVAVTPEKAAPEDAAFRDTAQTDSTLATDEDGALLMEGDSYVWLEPQIMLSVKKVDAAGKYLAGAGFEIRDESGKVLVSWTSGEAAKILSGSDTAAMETGRTYLLYEVQTPEGYATAEPVSFVVEDKRVGGQELYVQDIDRVVNVTCTPSPTPEAQTSESAQITPPTKTGGRPGTTLTPEPNKSEGTSPTPAGGGSQDQTPAPEGAQTGDKPTVPSTREEVEQTVDIARLPRTDSVPDGGYEIEISDGQSVVFDSNGEAIGLRSAVQTGDSSGIMRELYIFVAVGLILLVLIIKKRGFGRN